MWASNLHLPLCLSRRGTWPEFVNSERGNIKSRERERGRERGQKEGRERERREREREREERREREEGKSSHLRAP